MYKILNIFTSCLGGREDKRNTEGERSRLLTQSDERSVARGYLDGLPERPKGTPFIVDSHPIMAGENFGGFSDFGSSDGEFFNCESSERDSSVEGSPIMAGANFGGFGNCESSDSESSDGEFFDCVSSKYASGLNLRGNSIAAKDGRNLNV